MTSTTIRIRYSNTMTSQERELTALKNKHERENMLADIRLPQRKKPELRGLIKQCQSMIELLHGYEQQVEMPDIASAMNNYFEQCIGRIIALSKPST